MTPWGKSLLCCRSAWLAIPHTHLFHFDREEHGKDLRWDRMGTIVTEPIRYNTSSHLVKFFRHYSRASPAMRGMDQSVSDPTPTEAAAARRLLELDDTVPLVKLKIPRAGCASDYFVTSTPGQRPIHPRAHYSHVPRVQYYVGKEGSSERFMEGRSAGHTGRGENIQHADEALSVIFLVVSHQEISQRKYHATITKDYTTAPWHVIQAPISFLINTIISPGCHRPYPHQVRVLL